MATYPGNGRSAAVAGPAGRLAGSPPPGSASPGSVARSPSSLSAITTIADDDDGSHRKRHGATEHAQKSDDAHAANTRGGYAALIVGGIDVDSRASR